jgi:hypothetical protein
VTKAIDRYLVRVENWYGRLPLRGMQQREDGVPDLTLDDVYVSLAAQVSEEKNRQRRGRLEMESPVPGPIDMRQLLRLGSRLVIIGGPGSGKTTYLRLIATALARAIRTGDDTPVRERLGLRGVLPLPIYLSLSEYHRYWQTHARDRDPRKGTLLDFISHSLIRHQAVIGLPGDFFEHVLTQGQACCLLMDHGRPG